MIPEFIHNLKKIVFKFQRSILKSVGSFPGSSVASSASKNINIEIREYQKPLFDIRYVLTKMVNKISFTIKEKSPGIRLEAVLTGELIDVSDQDTTQTIRAGEYRLSDKPEFVALFRKNSACSYFITRYSDELLDQIGIRLMVKACTPRFLNPKMNELIHSVLHNHDEEEILRNFHFDNCMRELLLLHLTNTDIPMPGNLNDDDLSRIYAADSLLRQDLKIHDAIPALAGKAGINESKLKKGFRTVYKMGVFERLTWHRMERAKLLLKTTSRTIDDIADEAGYSSRTSFITAFRKIHAATPKIWRMSNR